MAADGPDDFCHGLLALRQRCFDGFSWVGWASCCLPVRFLGLSRANKFAHATRRPHRATRQSIPDTALVVGILGHCSEINESGEDAGGAGIQLVGPPQAADRLVPVVHPHVEKA